MKKWKRVFTAMLAAAVTVSVAACSGPAEETGGSSEAASAAVEGTAGGKNITIAISAPSGGLDPAGVALDFWVSYSQLCISPLISFDEN